MPPLDVQVMPMPPSTARVYWVIPENGKTFVGPGEKGGRTEVYVHISANGRIEVKCKRNGDFLADLYVRAEP